MYLFLLWIIHRRITSSSWIFSRGESWGVWSIINTLSLHLQQTWFSSVLSLQTKLRYLNNFFRFTNYMVEKMRVNERKMDEKFNPKWDSLWNIHPQSKPKQTNRVALQSHVYKDIIHVVKGKTKAKLKNLSISKTNHFSWSSSNRQFIS